MTPDDPGRRRTLMAVRMAASSLPSLLSRAHGDADGPRAPTFVRNVWPLWLSCTLSGVPGRVRKLTDKTAGEKRPHFIGLGRVHEAGGGEGSPVGARTRTGARSPAEGQSRKLARLRTSAH